MIALKNVTVMRHEKPVLKELSLAIRPKECVCIQGDEQEALVSLFRVLGTMEKPLDGSVEVDNVDVSVLPQPVLQLFRSRLGLVFDPPLLINHLTLGQNISLPLHLRGLPSSVITTATDDLLKRCGLVQRVAAFPPNLTDEEKQMTCIARCLISAPLVIVALEPFHGLSEKNKTTVAALFQNLRKKGATVIFLSRTDECARLMQVSPLALRNGDLEYEAAVAPRPAEHMESSSVFTPSSLLKETDDDEVRVRASQETPAQKQPATEKKAGKIHITSIGSSLS